MISGARYHLQKRRFTFLTKEFLPRSALSPHLVATYPVISFSVGLASPKSRIFSSQSSFTAMLEGFKSWDTRGARREGEGERKKV